MSARNDQTKAILSLIDEKSIISSSGITPAQMDLNLLGMSFTPALSLVKSRQVNKNNFLSTSYPASSTMSINFRTGDSFHNGRNCWLAFRVHNTSDASDDTKRALLGSNGAFSLIESVTLTSAGGETLSRTPEVSRIAPLLLKMRRSPHWFQTYGSLMGFPNTTTYYDSAAARVPSYTSATVGAVPVSAAASADGPFFMLPLSALCGVFDTATLIPPHLIAGARLDIKLRSAQEGLAWEDTAASIDYTVYDAHVLSDELFLSDAANVVLARRLAENTNFEFQFSEIDAMSFAVATSAATLSYSRAFSNVSKLWLLETDAINATAATEAKVDTNVSANTVTQAQARIGSTLLPNERITQLKHLYMQTVNAANDGKIPDHGINYRYVDFTSYHPVIGWDCERSSAPLALSGAQLASGKACQIDITRSTTSSKVFFILAELTAMARIGKDRIKIVH